MEVRLEGKLVMGVKSVGVEVGMEPLGVEVGIGWSSLGAELAAGLESEFGVEVGLENELGVVVGFGEGSLKVERGVAVELEMWA